MELRRVLVVDIAQEIRCLREAGPYPGLHVMDGSVMPANPGVNRSLTIAALAKRAMSLRPNNGDFEARTLPGSSYKRIRPVTTSPHRAQGSLGPIAPGCNGGRGHSAVSVLIADTATERRTMISDRTRTAEFRILGDAIKLQENDVPRCYLADLRRRYLSPTSAASYTLLTTSTEVIRFRADF